MKVAFTSCSHVRRTNQETQPIWGVIHKQGPDLLLLLGDNVYLGKTNYNQTDLTLKMEALGRKYDNQLTEPHFKTLTDDIPFLAIWDNHDFGLPGDGFEPINDNVPRIIYGADVDQLFRDWSRKIFNAKLRSKPKSIDRPSNSKIYNTHELDDGHGKKIRFFMLDVRSMQTDPKEIILVRNKTLLGTEQEDWLIEQLDMSTANINVICSGVPYSAWQHYGRWIDRFNIAIGKKQRVLFLAGQVHHNAFKTHPVNGQRKNFYEVVSSGVGQNFKKAVVELPHYHDAEEADIEELQETLYLNNEEITWNPTLANKPRNNYGIIDFTEDQVIVSLYGQFADDMHYVVIRRSDWKVDGEFSMQKK